MATSERLFYLAGIFDGEGCVTASFDKRRAVVVCKVSMVDERIPRLFLEKNLKRYLAA